jgi:predicted ATPase
MLNGIHLVDFGNHRNTRLTFGRMTALVGQNGAGKTTVMRAIEELDLAVENNAKRRVEEEYTRAGAMSDPILTASWSNPMRRDSVERGLQLRWGKTWCLRRRKSDTEPVWVPEPEEIPEGLPFETSPEVMGARMLAELHPGEKAYFLRAALEWSCRYFKANASSLQAPAPAALHGASLNSSGSNLAWALSSLMTEHPEVFQQIVSSLKEVVPLVKRIRSRAVSLTRTDKQVVTINGKERSFDEERVVPGQELIFDMRSGDNLPATMVSEGTLVVLAVLTLLHGAKADLIMLDDVELGLHPKAQRDLIRQLRRIQETHPKLQIILSTHSPYVVDEMKPEEVWVFAPDAEGCAVVHRLDEHPNAKRAMEVLTTGDFWSAEGEEWVVNATETGGPGAPVARVAEEPPAA